MGYSHYFDQRRSFTKDEWVQVQEDIGILLKNIQHVQGVALANGMGEARTGPVFTADRISFNGLGDDCCETFAIDRVRRRDRDWFCKTRENPYDLAVQVCLIYLSTITETHHVTSDGGGAAWVKAVAVARDALPRYANQFDIPMGIMQSDRWRGTPNINNESRSYELQFCVDGHAYITRLKDGAAYQFPDFVEAARFAEDCRDPTDAWGDGQRGKYSLFKTYGRFDENRCKKIKNEQTRILRAKFEHGQMWAPERMVRPPAYVRPDFISPVAEKDLVYNFSDLLKVAA